MSVIPSFRQPEFFAMRPPVVGAMRAWQPQELSLSVELPQQQYKTRKMVTVPFDSQMTNGKFETLADAMIFIARHCQFHHQQFNRNLARLYLKQCRVLDLVKGGFVRPAHLTKREFDGAFHQAMKVVAN